MKRCKAELHWGKIHRKCDGTCRHITSHWAIIHRRDRRWIELRWTGDDRPRAAVKKKKASKR